MAANNETQVRITAETSQFQREVARASTALKDLGTSAASSFTGIGAGALAAGAIGAAFAAAAKNAINLADSMSKMAQKTGVSIETLSALRVAGELSDVSLEELQGSFSKLANVMDASTVAGSEQSMLFARLGVSVRDASGHLRGSDEVLADIAERFKQMPDGAQKTAFAVQLFGESGAKLIPLLNGGKEGLAAFREEAEKLGVVMSTELGKQAEEFNDNLTRLKLAAEGAGLQIAAGLLPALQGVSEALVEMTKSGDGFKGTGETLGEIIKALAGGAIVIGTAFKNIAGDLAALAAAMSFAITGEFSKAAAVFEERGKDLQTANEGMVKSLEALSGAHRESAQKVLEAEQAKANALKGQAAAEAKILENQVKAIHDATKAQISDQEKLRDAVRKAFEESLADAKKFADEAKKLRESAVEKKKSRADQADDKLAGLKPEEEQQQRMLDKALEASREANLLAAQATMKSFTGDIEGTNKLAEQALKAAEKAAGYADKVADQEFGAEIIAKIGNVEEEALNAQAKVAEGQAKEAEARAQGQTALIETLNAKVVELQQMLASIPVTLDITQAERQLEELRSRIAAAGVTVPASLPAPGFWSGGWTGPGTKFQPAGIVHADEFVLRQEVVRQRGALDFLRRFNLVGMDALPGYASGGLVSRLSVPSLSSAGGNRAQLAPAVFNIHGLGTFPVSAAPDVMKDLKAAFSREALRKGRR